MPALAPSLSVAQAMSREPLLDAFAGAEYAYLRLCPPYLPDVPHLNTMPGGVDVCIEVFCVHDKRVLLRKHDKYDIWLGVGGHVEPTEDPAEAAIREVREEVGLELELPAPPDVPGSDRHRQISPPRYLDRHPINDEHEHVALVYFGYVSSDAILPGPGEADVEHRWLTVDQVLDPALEVMPSIRFYALKALAELA